MENFRLCGRKGIRYKGIKYKGIKYKGYKGNLKLDAGYWILDIGW